MQAKRMIWICAAVGSWAGAYAPALWGVGYFSIASIFFSGVGAIVGIWIAFKVTHH